MFTIKEFPGRRFASVEEADRAIAERNEYIKLLAKLGRAMRSISYAVYKITKVRHETQKEKDRKSSSQNGKTGAEKRAQGAAKT